VSTTKTETTIAEFTLAEHFKAHIQIVRIVEISPTEKFESYRIDINENGVVVSHTRETQLATWDLFQVAVEQIVEKAKN
jgi:hypothetical protein